MVSACIVDGDDQELPHNYCLPDAENIAGTPVAAYLIRICLVRLIVPQVRFIVCFKQVLRKWAAVHR